MVGKQQRFKNSKKRASQNWLYKEIVKSLKFSSSKNIS